MNTPQQSDKTFQDINQIIWDYLEARDWHKNPPRGLATSILLEAGELLEHYQWRDEPVGNREELAEELADIFIYAFQFAQVTGIDITEAIEKKLTKTAKKYPAETFKGKGEAERTASWLDAKVNYKKEGL